MDTVKEKKSSTANAVLPLNVSYFIYSTGFARQDL